MPSVSGGRIKDCYFHVTITFYMFAFYIATDTAPEYAPAPDIITDRKTVDDDFFKESVNGHFIWNSVNLTKEFYEGINSRRRPRPIGTFNTRVRRNFGFLPEDRKSFNYRRN